jgi:hypothetical protein
MEDIAWEADTRRPGFIKAGHFLAISDLSLSWSLQLSPSGFVSHLVVATLFILVADYPL